MPVKPTANLLSRKIHHLLLLQVVILCAFISSSQTNISGVINSYYKVVEVIPAKACVRLNTVAGLAHLNKTLIIQMKGASVNTANSSTFGDTTALNNAGNYELAIICAINGDSVFMYHNFLNSYTVAGKVQLVKFAEYYSAKVIDTVKASPWDNTAGTGGVIAISVSQDLTLNAPIYADSSGFRGGGYVLSNGTCFNTPFAATGYIYNAANTSPQNGAAKGEGVYDFPAGQSGGRGAPANGGGGGNNHNNGGAGGANLNAGGKGGGNSSSAGCTTELHGLPGKALSSWTGKKLFFGGGGGAGHSNGTVTASKGGGHGGGIILIEADNLIGNGYKITANGAKGGNGASDGASGGGAGGSIIMDVNTYSGALTLQANGGKGGDENDLGTAQRCYGAGGGGSGGPIYFTGSIPPVTISLAGGTAGLEFGGDPACHAQVVAANGLNGSTISPYVIRQATDSSAYCLSTDPLAIRLIYFKIAAVEPGILLQWRVANPETIEEFIVEKVINGEWLAISTLTPTDQKNQYYNYTDEQPGAGRNLYRIRMIEKNSSLSYSPVRQLNWGQKNDRFALYPNPASHQVVVMGDLPTDSRIRLMEASGKLIWDKQIINNTGNITIDLSPFQPGVYFLQIENAVKKLIIYK